MYIPYPSLNCLKPYVTQKLQYPFGKDLNFCVHGQEGHAKVQLLISKAEEDSSLLSYFENLVHVLEI